MKTKGVTAGLLMLVFAFALGERIYAHGGEDHGEAPKTTTTDKGIVIRTIRLGDLEVALKHSALEPDIPLHADLFFTRYETNEPVDPFGLEIAAESAGGSIVPVSFEKTSLPGSYTLMLPALAEGEYTLRATVTNAGKTATATFSGISVAHSVTGEAASGSWAQFFLTLFFVLGGAVLLAALVYFAFRAFRSEPRTEEEPVSV